jgi:CHAT domain-containing protein
LLRFEIILYANRFGFRQNLDDKHTLGQLYEGIGTLSDQLPPPWRDTTYALWVLHHVTHRLSQEEIEQTVRAVANELNHTHGHLDADFLMFKYRSIQKNFPQNAINALNFLENASPVGDDYVSLPLGNDEVEVFNIHASLHSVLGSLSHDDLAFIKRLQSSYQSVNSITGRIRVLEYLLWRKYNEPATLRELRDAFESAGDIFAMHYVVGIAEVGRLVENNLYPRARLRLEQLLEDPRIPPIRLKMLYSGYIQSIYAELGISPKAVNSPGELSDNSPPSSSNPIPVLFGRSGKDFLAELSKASPDTNGSESSANWPLPVRNYLEAVRVGFRVEEIINTIEQNESNPAAVNSLLAELKQIMSLRTLESWKSGSYEPLQPVSVFYNIAKVHFFLTSFASVDTAASLIEMRKYLDYALSMNPDAYWEFHCHLLMANAWTPVESEQTTETRRSALEHFWKAEKLSTKFRLQTPFSPPRFGGRLETLEIKQTFAKSIDEGATLQRVLYSTILGAGGSFSDVDARFFEEQTWALIQVSKSRALLDVAGTEEDDATTEDPSTEHEVLELTSQPPFTLEDLKSLTNKSEREIIFVDWVCLIGQIYMVAVGETGRPTIFWLRYTPQEILEWKKQHLNSATMEDLITADKQLNELRGLVEPLTLLARDKEMLVFCPSGPLHDIPLHAIPLKDKPIIDNHPVVYASSFNLLFRCLHWSCSRKETPSTSVNLDSDQLSQNVVVSVYERGSSEEMASLQHFTETLAHLLNATTLSGSDAIPSKILPSVNQARIFHFHGHVHFDPEKPQQHALELGGGELWTVRDMFVGLDLALHHPLVTIIGCDSGRERYGVGDEPLGAKTAFFQAGAASFVGTLWPISAADGRNFAMEFYRSGAGPDSAETKQRMQEEMQYLAVRGIERNAGHGDEDDLGRFANLAVAHQKAVLRIKADGKTRAPYHWASFVLSGSWLFRRQHAAPAAGVEEAREDSRGERGNQFGLGGTKAMSEALPQSPERDRYRAVWKSHVSILLCQQHPSCLLPVCMAPPVRSDPLSPMQRNELTLRLNSIKSQVLSLMKRLLDVMETIQANSAQSSIDDLRDTIESFKQTTVFSKSDEIPFLVMTLYSRLEADFKVYVDDLGSKRGHFGSDEEFRMALFRSMVSTVAEFESYIEMNFAEMEADMWLQDEMMEKLDIHHQERLLYYECVCQLYEEMCWSKTPRFRVYRTRMDS